MAFGVADDDDGFESGALTGAGLLLHGLDLQSHRWGLAILIASLNCLQYRW